MFHNIGDGLKRTLALMRRYESVLQVQVAKTPLWQIQIMNISFRGEKTFQKFWACILVYSVQQSRQAITLLDSFADMSSDILNIQLEALRFALGSTESVSENVTNNLRKGYEKHFVLRRWNGIKQLNLHSAEFPAVYKVVSVRLSIALHLIPAMSLSVPIPDGVYQILNVAYPNQDADLVYPGGVNDYIGGWQQNNDSQRMQWQVTNVVDSPVVGEISIYNIGVGTYASAAIPPYPFPNTPVTGNPSSTVIWAVGVSPNLDGSGQYGISMFDTPYVWTLQDGTDGAPIVLQESTGLPQPNQLWTFVKLD